MSDMSKTAQLAMICVQVQAEAVRAARIHGWKEQLPITYPQVRRCWKLFDAASAQDIVRGLVDSNCVTWFDVMMEEVCEAATETDSPRRLREELIQVAAMAVSIVRTIDDRLEQAEEQSGGS
jgi:hypothetical protein